MNPYLARTYVSTLVAQLAKNPLAMQEKERKRERERERENEVAQSCPTLCNPMD